MLFRASILASSLELERDATLAIELAQAHGEDDLKAIALAFQGMAGVSQGRITEGMTLLDEAMTMATGGEVRNFAAISEIYCVMLSPCDAVGDIPRAEQWCPSATTFARKHHSSFLAAYCRTIYGGLLTATGQWDAAEAELTSAMRAFESGHRGLRRHAALKLADLFVLQGRLPAAELLLAGYEDQEAAAVPLARLHLAQGHAPLARAVLEQLINPDTAPEPGLEPALLLLVDVRLALGDMAAAETAADQLELIAKRTRSDIHQAAAELARGRIKRQIGDPTAGSHYRTALERVHSYGQSRVAGQARLEMGYLLQESDWPGAVTWARTALATFTRIGAVHDAEAAERVLRQLGSPGRPLRHHSGTLTRREHEVMDLLVHGLTNRQIGERLSISMKTAEHHVCSILDKLGVQSRTEAAVLATRGNQNQLIVSSIPTREFGGPQ